MGTIRAYTNTPIPIDLREDVRDNGWTIEGSKLIHNGCNQGFVKRLNFNTVVGKSYKITYRVEDYLSGIVRGVVGGEAGEERSKNGTFTDTITATDTSGVMFYSDGNLSIVELQTADESGEIAGLTISYNEGKKFWTGYESYVPEYMNKFLDKFVTFKDGELWVHNTNEIRNMYYGVKYPSIITFTANVQYDEEKDFYTFYIQGNKPWGVEVTVPPTEGKPNGQRSRIKKGNFKFYKGRYFADFLRDMNDTRFDTELQALMKGAYLQGFLMKVTMTIDNDDHVELVSSTVDVSVK